ncbi:hypothetical protein C8R44DRAFT_754441 [Mycena epipterygia]|nr:hypothetical protein C8R44DRAFT_754441 [Mycena epipterygia]
MNNTTYPHNLAACGEGALLPSSLPATYVTRACFFCPLPPTKWAPLWIYRPLFSHTSGGLQHENAAELDANSTDVKRRVRDLRAELDAEREPQSEDTDETNEQGMSAFWVLQTALAEMRLRFEEQRVGRREAERLCLAATYISALKSTLESMDAKLGESEVKFEVLDEEVRMVQTGIDIDIAFNNAEEASAIPLMMALFPMFFFFYAASDATPEQKNDHLELNLTAFQTSLEEREEELAIVCFPIQAYQSDDMTDNTVGQQLAQEELSSDNATAALLQVELDARSTSASRMETANA